MLNIRKQSYFCIVFLITALLLLAACGNRQSDDSASDAAPTEEAAPADDAAEDAAPAEESEPAEEEEADADDAAAEPTAEPEAEEPAEVITDTQEMTGTQEMTETSAMAAAAAITEGLSMTASAVLSDVAAIINAEPITDAVPVSLDLSVMEGHSILASSVIGYRIENADGDNIGEIEDIVVHMIDGHVLFVTMRYGGGLFQSAQVIPVPTSAFTVDAENEVLRLDVDEASLEEAPSFDSGWPHMTAEGYDPGEYDADVYTYWSEQFPELPVPGQNAASDVAGAVAKVSDMMGLHVVNPQGERIGEIHDLIFNRDQQLLSAAVLTFGGFRLIGTDSYVIPYAGFSLDVSGVDQNNPIGTPVLNLSQNNLGNAPQFIASSVDLDDPNWSEPYQDWWVRMAETASAGEGPLALAMTAWVLESFGEPEDNLPVLEGTRPSVNFLLERYLGTGGCNWFLGVYTAGTDGLLRMQTPASSMTSICEPEALMEQEGLFMSSLLNVTEYVMEGENLVGYTVGNQRMLTLAPATVVPFEGTPWALRFFLTDIQWVPLIIGTEITAQFEGDQVSGSAGCNTYSATVTREGDAMTISDLTVTEQTCTEPAGIMEQEAQFLSALESVVTYLHLGGTVQMADSTEQPTLLFGLDLEVAAE